MPRERTSRCGTSSADISVTEPKYTSARRPSDTNTTSRRGILFVSHWSGSGGAEKALYEIIEHAHLHLRIPCACVVPWRGSLYRNLRSIGVRCFVLPYRWWCGEGIPRWKRFGRTLLSLLLAPVLAAIVLATRSTVVYSNTYTVPIGAMAALLTRRPHVWHVHEMFGNRTFDLGEHVSKVMMARLTTLMIAPSDAVRDFYSPFIGTHKLTRIHNAIRLRSRASEDNDTAPVPGRMVIVGAVNRQKGQLEAVLGLSELVDRGRDADLHIVGDVDQPAYKQVLDQVIERRGLQQRVKFTGLLSNPVPEVLSAQVVLVCAQGEAFGRATVEAMLLSRPIVAASSGATLELVEEGVNGLLYEPGDVMQLANQVERLLDDPALVSELTRRARSKATKEFGFDRFSREWLEVVDRAVFGAAGRTPRP